MGGLSPVSLLLPRSLDRLDSVDMLLPSKCPSWEEDYNPISDSLNDSSCISQVRGTRSEGGGLGTVLSSVQSAALRSHLQCLRLGSNVPSSERPLLVTLHTVVLHAVPRPCFPMSLPGIVLESFADLYVILHLETRGLLAYCLVPCRSP